MSDNAELSATLVLFTHHHHHHNYHNQSTPSSSPAMMNLIKLGNHVIAPAGTERAPNVTSPETTEVLALARLLQSKIRDLEIAVAEQKARRKEWNTRIAKLDKSLVSLREQDAKEGEKLDKLFKRLNGTTLSAQRHGVDPAFTSLWELDDPCPTTIAASSFNGNLDRYRDTYTFLGTARQLTTASTSNVEHISSLPPSSSADGRNSFSFTFDRELDTGVDSQSGLIDHRQPLAREHNWAVLSEIRNAGEGASGESSGKKHANTNGEADLNNNGPGPYKKVKTTVAPVDIVRRRSSRNKGRKNEVDRRSNPLPGAQGGGSTIDYSATAVERIPSATMETTDIDTLNTTRPDMPERSNSAKGRTAFGGQLPDTKPHSEGMF
ncbi:hypothetical protein C8J57DRAFT_1502827 [Mycena rebaudengoi]|nr:hypothetical protein C8J57DRAFT_1502827 [Mycena rebaudengoi]